MKRETMIRRSRIARLLRVFLRTNGSTIPWWLVFVMSLAIAAIGAALTIALLPTAAAQMTTTVAVGPDGNVVSVTQLPDVRCRDDAMGCYAQHVIMGYGDDMQARAHELDHVAGMRHGVWLRSGNGDVCASVTVGGHTQWRVGNLLCRRADGSYYQISP